MQLRNASRKQRPGTYREYTGPTGPERPTFVHDDPSFDAEVAVHCAFPSLDMHHPGPGPSEVWKARRKVETEAAKHPGVVIDCDREGSEQEDTEYPENNDPPRDIDDHDDHGVRDHGEDGSVSFPQCSPKTDASPHRLFLTTKDMSKAPRGSTQTQQRRPHPLQQVTTLDQDGDTIMVSPAYENKAQHGGPRNRRRLTVSVTKRLLSPAPFVSEMPRPGEGRPARTVSLGQRSPRKVVVDDGDDLDEPLDSPEIVQSSVNEEFSATDTFKPFTGWPGPSYINLDLDEEEEEEEGNLITEPFRTYPNWSELSRGVKYLIFYDLTQKGHSFVRACRMLSLDFGESKEMIDMIVDQSGKLTKARERLAQADNLANTDWLGRVLSDHREGELVTDSLTDDDIRRGKTFLKFMGLRDVAANLDYYQQSCMGGASEGFDIPLNHFEGDGWQGLIPHFLVGCREELLKMYFAWKEDRKRRRAMCDGEMHVRMDAPPGTVNPKKVERLETIEFWQDFDAKDIGGGLPLHPDNFLIELGEGSLVNILDDSVITEQEREKRRAVQGDVALKARDDWFSGPAPKRWPGDRFSLFNQRQTQREQLGRQGQREQLGPEQEQMVAERMYQLGWEVPQGFTVPQNREPQGLRSAAERLVPGAPGMSTHNGERQQPGFVDLTQSSQPNAQAFIQSESRAETLANRDRPSWPNPQPHAPDSTTDRLVTRAQPSPPNAQTPASDPRANPLALMEPDQSLDMAINSVLSRYHDHLNEPAKSNWTPLNRRPQSLDPDFNEFEEELRNISTRNRRKKKQVQFEDDSYDDEESPRKKKKSPVKKGRNEAGQHGTPRFDSSRSRGTGNRRTSFDDEPTPIQPRQRRNAIHGDTFPEDTHGRPNQANFRQSGGNSRAHQGDLHPRPTKRTDMADSGPPQPTKVRIMNNKSAIKLVPASEYYSNETAESGGVSNLQVSRNSSSPEPNGVFGSEFGYAAPNEQDTGQAHHAGHEESRPAIPTPSRAGIGDQTARASRDSQAAQPPSGDGERVEEEIIVGHPEAFFTLKSPPAPRKGGLGAVRRKRPSLLPVNTQRITPVPNRNSVEQQSDFEHRETLAAAAPMHPDTLKITKSTTEAQGGSRSENPNPALEATSSGQEAGKGDMGAGPNDQGLSKHQELGTGKPPKKPKTRKRPSSTKAATRSEGAPGSQPAPPKRQSTTPIPLPNIPGMYMRPPFPRLPDIRNPASYKSSGSQSGPSQPTPSVIPPAGETRSTSQEIMSEEQIRRMGPKRAEVEIYRNRERAKSAVASSNRSSSNGSGNHNNSSPQSATSKKPDALPAGKTGTPGIEPASPRYTGETPSTSQQTHRLGPQPSMPTLGFPRAQSPPVMNPIPGALQHQSPAINHNSPGPSRLDLPPRVSGERSVNPSTDRSSPHFSPKVPRSIRSIAQMQDSLAMPTTNKRGAETNSDPFEGRVGFGPQTHGIVSPMLNLPGNFGRGQTSNYIQAQDESISKAFDFAKEANFGLRMPDSISSNGGHGIRGGFVPGPPAGPNVQQHHQNLSGEVQGGNSQRQRIPSSKRRISGAGPGPGPSQGVPGASVPGAMSNSTGPQTGYQRPVVGSTSTVNRNNNRVLSAGPGQPIWSSTQTPNFPQRVETGQGQSAFLGSPPQFNGFQAPLHQIQNQFAGQQQPRGVFLPQMPMSASSPERILTQPRPQFQGFNAGHYQASPPGSSAMSLPGMSIQRPVGSGNVMSPPGDILLNPTGMMNPQQAFIGGSLNQPIGPGWINKRGVDFGPVRRQLQHPIQIHTQGQGQNVPQQGLPGTGSPQAQFTVQGQGQGPSLGPSMLTRNGGIDLNMGMSGLDLGPGMGMDVDLSGGMGADVSVGDVAIDPRILGDMNDMDSSSDCNISQE